MIALLKKNLKTSPGASRRLAALILPALLIAAALVLPALPAAAASHPCIKTAIPIGGTNCVPTNESGQISDNPIFTLLLSVINFLAVGVGIAVVGGIVWGALLYVTSDGDPGKTKQGISVILNAFLGLLLFIFMYAALNFLVPGGLFRK